MLIVISYDVSTTTREGCHRLRRVAKLCESKGKRVQKSVFECKLNQMQFEELERALLKVIDQKQDNLRFYKIAQNVGCSVIEYGQFQSTDFDDPLIF